MIPNRFGDWKKKPRIKTKRIKEKGKTEQLSFQVEPSLREDLVALAYLRGDLGAYAGITRQLLTRAVREYIATDLTPEERKEYKSILSNVRDALMVSRMKRQERAQQEEIVERAMAEESETVLIMDGDPEEEDPSP